MNKRIKELALQAGGSHYPTVGGKTLEKFAELIVKECSQISKDHQRIYYESHGARIAKRLKNISELKND